MRLSMAMYSERFPATHRNLSDARSSINDWIRSPSRPPSVSERVAGDIDVVVTELAANVVDHTSSPWFDVAIGVDPQRVTIVVSNEGRADLVPSVERWGNTAVDDRGRGLRIVRAICDRIRVDGGTDEATITCEIDLDASAN